MYSARVALALVTTLTLGTMTVSARADKSSADRFKVSFKQFVKQSPQAAPMYRDHARELKVGSYRLKSWLALAAGPAIIGGAFALAPHLGLQPHDLVIPSIGTMIVAGFVSLGQHFDAERAKLLARVRTVVQAVKGGLEVPKPVIKDATSAMFVETMFQAVMAKGEKPETVRRNVLLLETVKTLEAMDALPND